MAIVADMPLALRRRLFQDNATRIYRISDVTAHAAAVKFG